VRSRRSHGSDGVDTSAEPWGTAPGRQPATLYTLANANGVEVRISDYGGIVQSIWVPDRHGNVANVALGFATLAGYTDSGGTHAGAIVGRYANRIANGRFTLGGRTFHLPQNEGTNTLHGGPDAFNTKVWRAVVGAGELRLTYTDPDGHNGFPGAVAVEVTYALTNADEVRIDYTATTTKPTVVNLTNHTYFNLAGAASGDVLGQLLRINADRFTPADARLIPTGEFTPVARTSLDFRQAKPLGRDIPAGGYGHNFILNGAGMRLAAFAEDPGSGRTLKTQTDQPGLQLYVPARSADRFALETQHFPDSPNQPNFPSTVLNPGETFRSTTIYEFGLVT
jgi:aldose 1-epimerase